MTNEQHMRRVLVVDDDRDVAELMQELLTLEGFEADLACDAESGLRKVRQGQWHAVLMDLDLGGSSGLAVARAMRAQLMTVTATAPMLVAVSGAAPQVLREAIQPGGFDHALRKPVDVEALLALLRRDVHHDDLPT